MKTASEIIKAIESWPQWAKDDFEERAAIKEFDAGKTREQAEREAFDIVKKRVEREKH